MSEPDGSPKASWQASRMEAAGVELDRGSRTFEICKIIQKSARSKRQIRSKFRVDPQIAPSKVSNRILFFSILSRP